MHDDVQRLGGEDAVRAIVGDLIERVRGDFIIGFFFEGRDAATIVQHEASLALSHLRGRNTYTGRPLAAVHQPLRINRGHFRRRLAFLERVLADHEVPADIANRWMAFERALEDVVTDGTECGPMPSR